MKTRAWCAALVAITLPLTGCATVLPPSPVGTTATAEVRDAANRVVGQAMLTQVSGGVRVVLEASGLPPGAHGVHLHAVGSCEPPAFASAGDHFNPTGKAHGLLNPTGPHAGDLPNLTIDADGKGRLETFNERITLAPGTTSVLDDDGTALIIHAAPDDFQTDPAGNTGARIACGKIEKPPQKR